ncbi:MAG: phospholipid carrier-dependent glycosyltransferase [Planctomycetaceae bacterium]
MPLLHRLNRPVWAIVAVTLLAGSLRFFHLSHPGEFVFDEVYYPKAGCIMLGWSNSACRIDSSDEKYWRTNQWDVGSWVHPELGKEQIALGIEAFGMDPFGWRFSTAVAGTLVVLFTAIMAQLLFGKPIWTFTAGLLIATESLNVVMSRVALLDMHLTLWVVIGFVCLLMDRRWIERRQPLPAPPDPEAETEALPPPPVYSPVWRPWRFAAGAAFGAAASVKWSGAMAIFAAVLLTYLWETTRRHRDGVSWSGAFFRGFARETFGMVLAFALVPAVVFMITWIPWLVHFHWNWGFWWNTQVRSYDFHAHDMQWFAKDPKTGLMTPTHPYYSHPWEWLPMLRPTSFYVKDLGPDIQDILAIGNPAIFWGSIVAFLYLAFAWRRKRDWRAGFLLLAFACQYLPWFPVKRPTFFFYVVVLTPFMVLAVVYLLRDLSDARIVVRTEEGEVATNPATGGPAISTANPYRPFVWIFVVVSVGLFVWQWPVLTAGQISDIHWRAIVWFNRWV